MRSSRKLSTANSLMLIDVVFSMFSLSFFVSPCYRMLTPMLTLTTCNCNCNPQTALKNCYCLLATIPERLETQLVEISSRVQILESGDLLISNIRASDAGLYICVRANEAGTVKGEAYLGVLGKCTRGKQGNPLEIATLTCKVIQSHEG